MKRVMVVLMVLLPLAAGAQEKNRAPAKDQPGATVSPQVIGSAVGDAAASGQTDTGTDPESIADAAQQPNAKPRVSTEPRSNPPPKIPPSMVGYIDNPIPESQMRIRFDAGFDDNFPDRAEFFYAKCGCDSPTGTPGPNALIANLNFQQLYMRAEFAPIRRFSVFTEVPIRFIQPQFIVPGTGSFGNQTGLSDVTAGFKFAAVASENTYVTFQFTGTFPSGDSTKGLGTNHYSVAPELLFYHRLTGRAALEGMVGDSHPINGSTFNGQGFSGDVVNYGIGPSYALYRGQSVQFAPVVELVGWSIHGGLETSASQKAILSSDGINILNIKVGARTLIGAHNSIYIGYGQELTHEFWYKELVRIEYRYSF